MGGAGAVSLIIRAALAGAATAPAADPGTDTACCVERCQQISLYFELKTRISSPVARPT